MSNPIIKALHELGLTGDVRAVVIGNNWHAGGGATLKVRSPIDSTTLAEFPATTPQQADAAAQAAAAAFPAWRDTPAPARGELVRRIGNAFREHKDALTTLVTWEAGKITAEAAGEVQEVIDICDFAVGLSRQLYGRTIVSERPQHRLSEYWHPLGPVGVISAFNFPIAVWSWNAMLGLVCGDPIVWKPSEKTPLSAVACQTLVQQVIAETTGAPPAISNVV